MENPIDVMCEDHPFNPVQQWSGLCSDAINNIRGMARPYAWYSLLSTCTAFSELRKEARGMLPKQIKLVKEAAECGSASLITYAMELGHPIGKGTLPAIIRSGNMDCALAIPKHLLRISMVKSLTTAAETNRLDFFEFVVDNSYPHKYTEKCRHAAYRAAARNDSTAVLRRLSCNGKPPGDLAAVAAEGPHGRSIMWAINNGADITEDVYIGIARGWAGGATPQDKIMKLFMMVYLLAKKRLGSSLPGSRTLAAAIGLNIPELLKWFAVERPGVKIDENSAEEAAKYGWVNVLEQCPAADIVIISEIAARYNRVNVLEWVYAGNKLKFEGHNVDKATKYGAIDVLKYIFDNGLNTDNCKINDCIAAEQGHPDILEYMVSIRMTIQKYASFGAACERKKTVLWWLRANGHLDNERALLGAINAKADNVKTVMWIEPNPANWSDKVYTALATSTYHHGLLYDLIEKNGCTSRLNDARDGKPSDDSDESTDDYSGDFDAQYGDNQLSHWYDSDEGGW